MRDLNVSVVQTPLHWENPHANRQMFEKLISNIKMTDLIVLPEMFTTGFSMNSKVLAESMHGETMQWLAEQAAHKQCAITGSLIIQDNGEFYNRLIFMKPDGQYDTYDKHHLFRMANEHEYFSAGGEKCIVNWLGWRICPLTCYDLRFPVWSRNRDEYDLLIYVANWPLKRAYAWRSLLVARAIENMSYVVGVNRIGIDENNVEYGGGSLFIDCGGGLIYDLLSVKACETRSFSMQTLLDYRARFPVHLDADLFTLMN